MAKITFAVLLLLQIACATAAAAAVKAPKPSATGGLSAAGKNDALQKGHATIGAALAKAQAAKTLIMPQATNTARRTDQHAALVACVNKVGKSSDALRKAAREFDKMYWTKDQKRQFYKKQILNALKSSSDEHSACYSLLNGVGGPGSDIMQKIRQLVDEAAKAGVAAQSFIQSMN